MVTPYAALGPLPASLQYLYPATPDYYYEYGDGYLYQVDRTDNLIASLIPLLAGGYLPGQYLPAAYMASYVPSFYGFDNFYPASYRRIRRLRRLLRQSLQSLRIRRGLPGRLLQRHGREVIPLYAGGYGVGQMLPIVLQLL